VGDTLTEETDLSTLANSTSVGEVISKVYLPIVNFSPAMIKMVDRTMHNVNNTRFITLLFKYLRLQR
jgi:hypothetical protein